jgi:16S rRNA (adenine1518-N6/adenine1519-N6)-dimethyltransferase
VPRTSTGSSSPRSDPGGFPGVPHRPKEVAERLAVIGVRPDRRWGQSFLTDPFVADAEAALLELAPGVPVTEIGGGLGLLTEALLRRGLGPITVVEKDPRLVAHLRATFGDRIRVAPGDALRVELGSPGGVIGNLPFSVAAPILTRLFEARVPRIVALLQREVAERYAAPAGSRTYGRPAIQAALYATVEIYAPVPAASFYPRPAVDGRLIRFLAHPGPLAVRSVPRLERLVRELFSRRRKQLGNLLPAALGGSERAAEFAAEAGWPAEWSQLRPEALSPEAYFALARVLENRAHP